MGTPALFKLFTLIIATFFVLVTLYVFRLIFITQPVPYIDEVFHVPQAKKYCNGLFFEWDNKITTLPGLYLISVGILKPLSWALGTNVCSIYYLRTINLITSVLNLYLFYAIQRRIRIQQKGCEQNQWKDACCALNLASFPLLYFFTFLYYTDTVSTFVVLLAYLLHLHHRDWCASCIGLVSVLVRQTNVMWVAFFTLRIATDVVRLEAVKQGRSFKGSAEIRPKYLKMLLETMAATYGHGTWNFLDLAKRILTRAGGYVFTLLAFTIFVTINKGVVVGDRAAHTPVLHALQVFYFALFTCAFAAPFTVTSIRSFLKTALRYRRSLFITTALCIFAVYTNTTAHPYLLADNRHYTFYIWRRVYQSNVLFKYLLVPAYVYALYSMHDLIRHTDIVFRLGYMLCVVSCIVPQQLLEFRYFILPYLLWRLQLQSPRWWQLVVEFLMYSLINTASVHLFVNRVFVWPNSDEWQRFIW